MPLNTRVALDELQLWQVGPTIQHQGEPLGGLLTVLGGLFDPDIRAIAVRNGLVSYSSILGDAFIYVPADITVPGFLEAADIADVEAALAPKAMLLEDLIDGKNRVVSAPDVHEQLEPVFRAYHDNPSNLTVLNGERSRIAEWLVAHQ